MNGGNDDECDDAVFVAELIRVSDEVEASRNPNPTHTQAPAPARIPNYDPSAAAPVFYIPAASHPSPSPDPRFSPPRELSQRPPLPPPTTAANARELERLKRELNRVSKQMNELKNECTELRKDRTKKGKEVAVKAFNLSWAKGLKSKRAKEAEIQNLRKALEEARTHLYQPTLPPARGLHSKNTPRMMMKKTRVTIRS